MAKTKFVNLTSHAMIMEDINGNTIKLKPSNHPFRLTDHIYDSVLKSGMQIMKVDYVIPKLPKFDLNVTYIVSKLVAYHVNRSDFVAPDTGISAVRVGGKIQMIRRLYSYDKDNANNTEHDI